MHLFIFFWDVRSYISLMLKSYKIFLAAFFSVLSLTQCMHLQQSVSEPLSKNELLKHVKTNYDVLSSFLIVFSTESSPKILHSSSSLCCILGIPASWDSSFCFSSLSVKRTAVFNCSKRQPPSPSNCNKWVWYFLYNQSEIILLAIIVESYFGYRFIMLIDFQK